MWAFFPLEKTLKFTADFLVLAFGSVEKNPRMSHEMEASGLRLSFRLLHLAVQSLPLCLAKSLGAV